MPTATPNNSAHAAQAAATAIVAALEANTALVSLCPAAGISLAWDLSTEALTHEIVVDASAAAAENLPPTAPLQEVEVSVDVVSDYDADPSGSGHRAIVAAAAAALYAALPNLSPTGWRLTGWTPPKATPAESSTGRRTALPFGISLQSTTL